MRNFKQKLTQNLLNIPGWRTNRKIVVIESDDWGSIRMPSLDVYNTLIKKGIRVDKQSYNRYDSLASGEDLSALFDVLSSVKDKNGNSAIITANTIVGNPDFNKISHSDFREYHYENFTETLQRYPKHTNSFQLWQEGMRSGIFRAQFHGREHLNVHRWLRALQNNVGNIRMAFDFRMFDLSTSMKISENSFMEALNLESKEELNFQKNSIREGLKIFEEIFGYKSKTFIAPCYTWSNELNETLLESGVQTFQGSWLQFEPVEGKEHKFNKKFHFIGQKNNLGQSYLVRNAIFEPSENEAFDWKGDVFQRANIIFRWGKPLILGSHRVNYIGFIDEKNRSRNLRIFKQLLDSLVNRWPDLEFMSSDQLSNLINKYKIYICVE